MKKQNYGDPLGEAVQGYSRTKKEAIIYVHSKDVESYELPVSMLFRAYQDMPPLEQLALDQCAGKVLDIGAGAGCHTQILQQKGFAVETLEISLKACEIMRQLGIQKVHHADIFQFHNEMKYDTLLLLMNGIGVCGTLEGFRKFLRHATNLLNPAGQILFDTSDIIYLYQEDLYNLNSRNYYGEISYRMEYKNILSDWFNWLYLDAETLQEIAQEEGYSTEIISYGKHYDYLVKLIKQPGKVQNKF